MRPPRKSSQKPYSLQPYLGRIWLFIGLFVEVVVAGCAWQHPHDSAQAITSTPSQAIGVVDNSVSSVQTGMITHSNELANPSSPIRLLAAPDFSWFQSHPFQVAESNAAYAWTAEDGRDTNVILHLAHNNLEYKRMLTENDAIYRRQLIYFTQGFNLPAEHAVQTGQSLRQITLPGLDGQELTVDVTKTDFRNGGSRGQIYGQLTGQPDSIVTVAFIDSREAFTVISPQNGIYLQAEAREPGEVVIKSINPATYGNLGAGK